MFFIISKILKVFLFPMTWVLGLLLVAVFIKDKKHSNRKLVLASLAVFLFLVFSDKPILQWAQYQTTKKYIEQKDPDRYYPVAVIMGGFGSMNETTGQMNPFSDRSGRLYEPVRLQKMGVVGRILVSGDATVYKDKNGKSNYPLFKKYVSQFGIPQDNVLAEQYARNTRENATLSIALLDSLGYTADDCLLVTSASHMKRSYKAFAAEGWDLDCYAVNIYPKPDEHKFVDYIPNYLTLTDWQELLNEWFGIVVYSVVGYN